MSKKIDFNTSLGEFVAQYPEIRDIFESYNLDYCCGGKKNIEIAAKEKNIDLDGFESLLKKIIEETPDTEKNKNWTDEPLIDIVDHIQKTHHVLAWEKLSSITILLNKLIQVHGEKHGDFLLRLENIFEEFKMKLETHLRMEEDIVFEYVKHLDKTSDMGSDKSFKMPNLDHEMLEFLQKDHEEVGEMLKQIKSFTSNYELPDYACASFAKLYADLETLEDDLHIHINLENTILFPRLEKLLD